MRGQPVPASNLVPSPPDGVPVHFLMFNVDAPDGISRAVLTLANHLSLTHPVEIISLYRRGQGPAFPISERITVSYLRDRPPISVTDDQPEPAGAPRAEQRGPVRHAVRRLLARRPSRVLRGRGFPDQSLLTDVLMVRKLRTIHTGVLVSTRPSLHLVAARLARSGVITIGQDHLNFESRSAERGTLALIHEASRRGLDAFVTLTPTDEVDYTTFLAASAVRVTTIPNPLPWPANPAGAHDRPVIVAAGRLVPRKGMGRLIRAFAPVARRHPEWELHIYGTGKLEQRLRDLVQRLGVSKQVRLLGHSDDLPDVFADAALFASGSRAEGFPMVLLEAMSTGLPLVSFDCPRGPSDIIRHGRNGLLVPRNDIPALSMALETVVADDEGRRAMGAQGLVDADQYVVARVAARWEALFADLRTRRDGGPGPEAGERPGPAEASAHLKAMSASVGD